MGKSAKSSSPRARPADTAAAIAFEENFRKAAGLAESASLEKATRANLEGLG